MPVPPVPADVLAEVDAHLRRALGPTFGGPHHLSEPAVSRDGLVVVVTAAVLDDLVGLPRAAIAVVHEGEFTAINAADHSAHSPSFASHGALLAYLTDEAQAGRFQLEVRDLADPDGRMEVATVPGSVESFAWSPNATRLVVVTERSGPGDATRRAWIVTTDGRDPAPLPVAGRACWEATWCGDECVAIIVSDTSREDDWYRTSLVIVDLATGAVRHELSHPGRQVALPVGSPDGRWIAWVEGHFSDRRLVAGPVQLCDLRTKTHRTLDVLDADVARLQWIDNWRLGFVGQRHFDCVAGYMDVGSDQVTELVTTDKGFAGRWGPDGAFTGEGDVVCVEEGYGEPQAVARTSCDGRVELARLSGPGFEYLARAGGSIQRVDWVSTDGLRVEGFLCTPPGPGPFPLILNIHGGPVTAFRNTWSLNGPWVPLLVRAGYAVLNPNPRGSTGRGQGYVASVVGDMAGLDTDDLLTGIDALVERGIADADRLGVIGISYGGFMAAWLVSQDDRFAAAVAIAPVTDWYSQTFTSSIPTWGRAFLDTDPEEPNGRMHQRSPVLHASAIHTPCLLIAGSVDNLTPPGQAIELHEALREHGVPTQLAVYPGEAHGIRAYPAVGDHLARILSWFATHLPCRPERLGPSGVSTDAPPSWRGDC